MRRGLRVLGFRVRVNVTMTQSHGGLRLRRRAGLGGPFNRIIKLTSRAPTVPVQCPRLIVRRRLAASESLA